MLDLKIQGLIVALACDTPILWFERYVIQKDVRSPIFAEAYQPLQSTIRL